MSNELLRVAAIEAAHAAGEVLRGPLIHDAGVQHSQGRDIKTQADLDAERVVLDRLAATGLPVLSEESGVRGDFDLSKPCWIVDPLDGTMNYVRGIPMACVSVALFDAQRPCFGVIHDVNSEATWCGGLDTPATCNDRPIHVGGAKRRSQAVLATGFPRSRDFSADAMGRSLERLAAYKKVRMIGSAAMSLAWTAAGHMDLYLEEDIFLWDVAAGLAIVEAAGGAVHWTPWDDQWRSTVLAGSPALVEAESR